MTKIKAPIVLTVDDGHTYERRCCGPNYSFVFSSDINDWIRSGKTNAKIKARKKW